ncbi:hypothetical protein Pst134EA_003281 [Puccinia striiformis f. sp. tritici]|nr:hypothetical protein Pst134EA_003281 [Puccinia striiformis f. sp. tritici]KAH9472677.1 hypothetical protein Pst134EA_003281 [Puccinia striiformis f. sp. tritici]
MSENSDQRNLGSSVATGGDSFLNHCGVLNGPSEVIAPGLMSRFGFRSVLRTKAPQMLSLALIILVFQVAYQSCAPITMVNNHRAHVPGLPMRFTPRPEPPLNSLASPRPFHNHLTNLDDSESERNAPRCMICLGDINMEEKPKRQKWPRITTIFSKKRPPGDEELESYAWPGCGHAFHEQCIARWVTQRKPCPLCQHEAPDTIPDHIYKIYREWYDDQMRSQEPRKNPSWMWRLALRLVQ